MTPEQAKVEQEDPRSDIFALGLIFYELLTVKMPFAAENAVASLLKRTQEAVRPPAELEPAIPPAVNEVVLKCLDRDPGRRYQNAQEILIELDGVHGRSRERTTENRATGSRSPQRWIAPGLSGVLFIASGVGLSK